jgi:predicted nucleic acid-binding protein
MTVQHYLTSWSPTLILIDVNVLVYAHRAEAIGHDRNRDWLTGIVNGDAGYGLSDLALPGSSELSHIHVSSISLPL